MTGCGRKFLFAGAAKTGRRDCRIAPGWRLIATTGESVLAPEQIYHMFQ